MFLKELPIDYPCANLKSPYLKRVQGVTNFKKTYLRNYLEYRNKILHGPMNWIKVFMSKISSKSMIWTGRPWVTWYGMTQGQLKYLFLHWQGVFNPDNIQGHTMNLSRRRVRFRFQSFYVYSTWYLNQFEFYKRRSAVLKSQSIIEQLRCTDFYKFLNVWLFLNDWLFLNVLMFDHQPTHPPPYDPPTKV